MVFFSKRKYVKKKKKPFPLFHLPAGVTVVLNSIPTITPTLTDNAQFTTESCPLHAASLRSLRGKGLVINYQEGGGGGYKMGKLRV